MALVDRFHAWVKGEIGSTALPALCRHMRRRDYRLFSFTEHGGRWRWDVYHPEFGFFHDQGSSGAEALLGVLRQIWIVESLHLGQEAGGRRPE